MTVLPWKELRRVMISFLPAPYLSKLYFRAILMAHSLASAPLLPKQTLDMPVRVQSFSASCARLRAVEVVGHMLDRLRLLCDRLDPALVAVAEAVDADARGNVDILLAVLVIGGHPLPLFRATS